MSTVASIRESRYSEPRFETRVLCVELVMEQQAILEREQERDKDLIRALCQSIKERDQRINECKELAGILDKSRAA